MQSFGLFYLDCNYTEIDPGGSKGSAEPPFRISVNITVGPPLSEHLCASSIIKVFR